MLQDPAAKRRWPRSQKFTLSSPGAEAEAAYRSTIVASRAQEGRASFDAARALWAATLRIEVDDGLYLGELRGGAKTLEELVTALDTCGKTKKDAVTALERLNDAGLVAAPRQTP